MRGLGYAQYAAGGGDFGSGIATFMALDDPGPLIGLHLTNLELTRGQGQAPGPCPRPSRPIWTRPSGRRGERGYTAIQSTKPQTLGYALNDLPPGWPSGSWRSG